MPKQPLKDRNRVRSVKVNVLMTPLERKRLLENNIRVSKVFRRGLKSTLKEISFSGNQTNPIDKKMNKLFLEQAKRRKKK